jgi:hypothetical protein
MKSTTDLKIAEDSNPEYTTALPLSLKNIIGTAANGFIMMPI